MVSLKATQKSCACVTPVELHRPSQSTESEVVEQHVPGINFVLLQLRVVHVYSHLNLSTSLQGCVFAVRTQSSSSIAPSVISAIGATCQAPNCDVKDSTHTLLLMLLINVLQRSTVVKHYHQILHSPLPPT